MSGFVHLHLHSEYSLLDGACRIKDIVKHAAELGQKAVAITDHGVMYGVIDFYNTAKAAGIKPVIGCEVYVARRTRHDRVHQYDNSSYHLILLCENNTGYHNLLKLVSEAHTDGFYNKPRTDTELLEKYHEGLICLSGCIAGEVASYLLDNNYDAARKTAEKYRKIFGPENFYLEIQNHGIINQQRILPLLCRLSHETGIPLVATNDVHYTLPGDAEIQKILLCIQTNTTIDEPSSVSFETDEFYMKSEEQMRQLFSAVPEAIENTVKIAERCSVELEFGVTKLPEYTNETGMDNLTYFKKLCFDGLYSRYGAEPDESLFARMNYEIEVISSMGYVDYYLIVSDFINYARSRDIPVGPGRGSGAGSICAYCMGITGIDPIKYNLIFERFLNPERVSMPDFDVDFCVERRSEVIDYVIKKYGADRVAQIVTFDTMAARSAVRDSGRAMGLPYTVCDKVARLIPTDLNITLEKALEKDEELRKLYNEDSQSRRLIDVAKKLEGMPRNTSVHAAGVVIASAPVNNFVPLKLGKDCITTQYPMADLEKLGMLKVDFLGLRNLTVIKKCTDSIRHNKNQNFDISKIPLDDQAVYSMLSAGHTSGVFQLESQGMRSVIMRLKPESIEDITAAISLFRPGPMDSIPRYEQNRHDVSNIKYKHPLLKDILEVTYGCIIYQEQVMEICRKLAGYSYGRADLVRRAMAKKKKSVMEEERHNFIYGLEGECSGAVNNGVPEAVAESIFDEMAGFASYAFNKSHAVCYSYIAYITAYLRYHYFNEYMAALLTSCSGNTAKLMEYISECEKSGVKLIRPSVNYSEVNFKADSDGIIFGLSGIKNIGSAVVSSIISERERNGEYKNINDFFLRNKASGISRRMAESLVYAGAFDDFGFNRRQIVLNLESIIAGSSEKGHIEGQLDFFSEAEHEKVFSIPFAEEYSDKERFRHEKETLGVYISGNPLLQYIDFRHLLRLPDIAHFSDGNKGILCIVSSIKKHITRKGDKMCFLSVEDLSGSCECVVFADHYSRYSDKLTEDAVIYLTGTVSNKDDKTNIIVSDILSEEEFLNMVSAKKLCIKTSESEFEELLLKLENIFTESGKMQLCFYFTETRKIFMRKNKDRINFSSDTLKFLKDKINEDNLALI